MDHLTDSEDSIPWPPGGFWSGATRTYRPGSHHRTVSLKESVPAEAHCRIEPTPPESTPWGTRIKRKKNNGNYKPLSKVLPSKVGSSPDAWPPSSVAKNSPIKPHSLVISGSEGTPPPA